VPHWTKRNFDDLEDRSPAEVPMRWCFSRNAIHSSQVGVSRFTYEPGARMPFGHRHREQEEVYVVVSGSGRAKLDDELIELTQWDVLRVAPPVIRAFEAGPDGLEVICVGGRRPNGGDTERFEDFCRQTHPRGERLARPTLTPQSKNSKRLCPTACPIRAQCPMAKPKSPGIIIRVSGVRVPPPAWKRLQMPLWNTVGARGMRSAALLGASRLARHAG
jgi:quercetin dioxygenase-like cupin family protein